eukprot:scaffold795_cov375-Prasinococcus_capsulatus_cf.AAC.24
MSRKKVLIARPPRFYSDRLQQRLQTDPAIVNLRGKNKYFYELAHKLAEHQSNPRQLKELVFNTFRERYRQLLLSALEPSKRKELHVATQEEQDRKAYTCCCEISEPCESSTQVLIGFVRNLVAVIDAGRHAHSSFTKWRYRCTDENLSAIAAGKRKRGDLAF